MCERRGIKKKESHLWAQNYIYTSFPAISMEKTTLESFIENNATNIKH